MSAIPAGYKQTEVGVIPEDWEIGALGNVCDVRDGTHESPRFFKQGVPFVTSKNIVDGRLDMENVSYISVVDATEFDKRSKVEINDVLMSMIGTIGSAVLIDYEPNFCIKNVALIKPRRIDPSFLIQLINSPLFQRYLNDNLDGGIQKFIALGTLRQLEIPEPKPAEQRAIAAALSDVDALLAKLDQLIAKKRDLKQATMQQLLTGQTRLPGFSGAWEVKRLGDVSQLINGFAFKSSTYDEFGCYKVVTIANVQDGFMSIDVCNKVARLPQDIQFHQRLIQGDILISMTGNVGRVCRVCDDDCLLNQRVGKLVPNGIDDRFLFAVLRQPRFLIEMVNKAKGGAQGNLSKADITEYEFKLPSSEEQTAIATLLSDMDAELAALEARRDKTRALKQGMMQELLTGRIRLV